MSGKYNINADDVRVGRNVVIETGVSISGVDGPAKKVMIGDNTYIGKGTRILTPYFSIGDYGKVYGDCRISGYKQCIIGHNFWMDQNCILNCTDNMEIGHNVGIGAYSQLWTHIKHGDVLEGCRFNSTKPMKIENDVWFVGHCIVSPIIAREKSMALVGSVVTRDMESNHVYGGCPAIDVTKKLGPPYTKRSVEQKYSDMMRMKNKFFSTHREYDDNEIMIVHEYPKQMSPGATYFNVSDRTYCKQGTEPEISFMKYLLPLFKFVPR